MGHKRKRQAESSTADEPSHKKQAVDKSTINSAAERRQKRSERKSKKAQQAKEGASKNKLKKSANSKLLNQNHDHEALAPELVQAIATTEDGLTQGQDFIPLTEPRTNGTDTSSKKATSKSKNTTNNTQKKVKRVSPRSQRKAAKAEKTKSSTENNNNNNNNNNNEEGDTSTNAASTRFIVFVGNLPYTTTDSQIKQHFRKLEPISIRHPTDKNDPHKSKGYAFLEFDNYSAMKTCLKVYHHSMFDPERTSKLPEDAFDENGLEITKPGQTIQDNKNRGSGRRINVELTAGGGGKGDGRKEKIRVKNTRLEEQRDRRRDAEMKAEKARNKKKGISGEAVASDQVEAAEKENKDDGRGDIHPSRLKRVKG